MKSAWALSAIVLLFSTAAAAGPNEQRLAQALFDEARRLMEQKRYAEACPKLAESQRLDPGGGTLLNLAVCHAAEGKTATALVEYSEALSVATRDGRRDREELARSAIATLEREVPRVTVMVPASARVQGLELKIDETPLPSVAWEVPMPVDPGGHSIVATIPGRAPWTAVVSLLPSERKVVEVPPLASAPAEPLPAPLPPPTMDSREPPPSAPAPLPDTQRNPLYVGIVVGTLAAGATATVAGIFALTERSKADDGCLVDRNWCSSAEARDAASTSATLAWVSTGALIAAGVGTIALFIVPSRRVTTRSVGSTLVLGTTF